jgi:hypothetical protein
MAKIMFKEIGLLGNHSLDSYVGILSLRSVSGFENVLTIKRLF